MLDTSLIERKIHSTVANVCFESIVSEAFIGGLPLPEAELTDGLTQRLAQYATECLKDLGSIELLKSALESEKSPMKRGYLQSMYTLCMETATDVTARILAENKDDKSLKDAAANVTLTEGEYSKFSKAAATLTPNTLTNMIQKKALDVIKDEKEAYQRDKELEEELKAAVTEDPTVEKEPESTEEAIDKAEDAGMQTEEVNELEDAAEPPATDLGDVERAPEGEEAPLVESDMSGSFMNAKPAMEGFGDFIRSIAGKFRKTNQSIAAPGVGPASAKPDAATGVRDEGSNLLGKPPVERIGKIDTTPFSYPRTPDLLRMCNITSRDDMSDFVNDMISIIVRRCDKPLAAIEAIGGTMKDGSTIDIVLLTFKNGDLAYGPVTWSVMFREVFNSVDRIQLYGSRCYGYYVQVDMKTEEWVVSTLHDMPTDPLMTYAKTLRIKEKSTGNYVVRGFVLTPLPVGIASESWTAPTKSKKNVLGKESFESFMEGVAGKNYRAKHSTIFSRLQELAYESILGTTEKYTEIPFETMSLITRQNTFGKFKSHWSKSVESMMDSIGRYAFESEGVDVPPPVKEEQLNSALLTASIIYTFFETLNSMNLYCPKLAEIKQFVDETLPIESRVELDKTQFMDLFKGIMSKAQSAAQKAMTVPDVDAVQGDLEIVRERCAAPGFENMRQEIDQRISQVQESINARRDFLVSKQQPKAPAVESATQLMRRERDTMKFSSLAGTTVAKPNISYTKIKIDPQGGSNYVAVECYTADNRIANKSTIVLESTNIPNLAQYVQAAVEGSRLPELHKRIMITDKRSGKVLFDKNWYGR